MTDGAAAVFACSVVFSVLAVLCGGTRIWARRIKNASFGLDDWIIVLDVPLAFGLAVAAEYMASKNYVGGNINELPLPAVLAFQKFLFAAELIVTFVVGTVKISVLLFYKRIFTTPRFKQIANVLIVCCVCWTLAFVLAIVFQCDPVQGAWNPLIKSTHRYNMGAMWVGMGTTDIFLDLSILSLPVPMIASLHLPRFRRILIGLIFAMGALCVVASATRLVNFVRVVPVSGSPGSDFSASVTDTIIWSILETCLSIIAACLPASWPAFQNGHGFHALALRTRSYALSFRSLLTTHSPRAASKTSTTTSLPGDEHELETAKVWAGGANKGHQTTSIRAMDLEASTSSLGRHDSIRVDQTFGYQVEGRP